MRTLLSISPSSVLHQPDKLHRMKHAAAFLILTVSASAATEWNKTEVMIPMRDGVRLHTIIYAPKNPAGKLPLLIERSPYGFTGDKVEKSLTGRYLQLAD